MNIKNPTHTQDLEHLNDLAALKQFLKERDILERYQTNHGTLESALDKLDKEIEHLEIKTGYHEEA